MNDSIQNIIVEKKHIYKQKKIEILNLQTYIENTYLNFRIEYNFGRKLLIRAFYICNELCERVSIKIEIL